MITTYQMSWMNDDNQHCRLTITDKLGGGKPDIIMLTPSEDPFITQEDNSTSPLIPVRTQTGVISFIADGNFSISVQNSHQWRVELSIYENSTWTIHWLGWLKGESFNQTFDLSLHEIQLNCICDLSVLDSIKMDPEKGFGMVTILSLFNEAFDLFDFSSYHVTIPTKVSCDRPNGVRDAYGLLLLQVSRYNFFKITNDQNNKTIHEGCTMLELIERICTFFGWSLRIVDMTLYFSSTGSTYFKSMRMISFLGGFFSTTTETRQAVTSITPTGKNHKYTIEAGKKEINITAKLNIVKQAIPSIDFNALEYSKMFPNEIKAWGENQEYGYMRCLVYKKPDNVTLKNVLAENVHDHTFSVSEISPYDEKTIAPEFSGASVHIVRCDRYLNKDLPDKHNWEYQEGVLVCLRYPMDSENPSFYYEMDGTSRMNNPAMTIKSNSVAFFKNGGFIINFSMLGSVSVVLNYYQDCLFRIGDKYWNGSSWTTSKSYFPIYFDGKNVRNTKTVYMDFYGNGYVMPINEQLFGEVEFQILYPNNLFNSPSRSYVITNLKVEYAPAYADTNLQTEAKTERLYSRKIDGWIKDTEDVTLDLNSYSTNGGRDAANYSMLSLGNDMSLNPLEYLTYYPGTLDKPEKALLQYYYRAFGVSRQILTLDVKTADNFPPSKYITIQNYNYEVISAISMNWKTCKAELLLREYSKVKDIGPSYPDVIDELNTEL